MLNTKADSVLSTMLATLERDIDYNCWINQGFKFALTVPGEVPILSRHSFKAQFSMFTKMSIKPNLITTSENLRHYKPQQRGCYFNSERKLHFFKMYTLINCREECVSNFTKKQCGCVIFHMPSKKSLCFLFKY